MLSENIYIEIFNKEKNEWSILCPFSNAIVSDKTKQYSEFKDHIINGLGMLYILTYK